MRLQIQSMKHIMIYRKLNLGSLKYWFQMRMKIEDAKTKARRPFDAKIRPLEQAIRELEGHQAVAGGDFKKALELLRKAGGGVDRMYLAMVQWQAGESDQAIKTARQHVNSRKNQVQPRAMLVELLWRADKKDEAKTEFEKLRELSGTIDLNASPVFTRLPPARRLLS